MGKRQSHQNWHVQQQKKQQFFHNKHPLEDKDACTFLLK